MLILLSIFYLIQIAYCSLGDSSPYFQKCTERCELLNCTQDFVDKSSQPFHLKVLKWDCHSECEYECMWKTIDAFQKRNWKIPQFYGKWPFIRILGIQEPASFISSLINLYIVYTGFKLFKNTIRADSPFFWMWNVYSLVTMNAWIWSTIFHARDFPITEFMDYTAAFSMILLNSYCMIRRVLVKMPRFLSIILTTFYVAFFLNHVIYLSNGKIDYKYNMILHLSIGTVTVTCWFIWSYWNRKQQPYLWKCAAFYTLTALLVTLEVFDFPPIFWIFDSHSLWHLATIITWPFLYEFIIADCKYLRQQKLFNKKDL